jgi:hypothetical protein
MKNKLIWSSSKKCQFVFKVKKKGLVLLAHSTVILATWEAEMGKIAVQGQPGEKVCESPSQLIAGNCGNGRVRWGRSWFQVSQGKIVHGTPSQEKKGE